MEALAIHSIYTPGLITMLVLLCMGTSSLDLPGALILTSFGRAGVPGSHAAAHSRLLCRTSRGETLGAHFVPPKGGPKLSPRDWRTTF